MNFSGFFKGGAKGAKGAKSVMVPGFALALACGAARAEDPLLGIIKAIKCVGCQPGTVTLVVHDPIDVRDFEVQIQDADYSKIVTPLPGKRVFDRAGCFYWYDISKVEKKPADSIQKPVKNSKKNISQKSAPTIAPADSSGKAETNDTGIPENAKESRCLPFTRVTQAGSSAPGESDSGGK